MESTIEYISAGIIISLILGLTIHFSTNIVNLKVNAIEQEMGFNMAENVLDTLLLSAGIPSNWGDSPDLPSSIGLALDNAIKLYQLDSAKIKRLSKESTNYIPPHMVRDLLGLGGCYYISFKIMPVFSMEVTNTTSESFSIRVTNRWGSPISNANITAAYINLEEIGSNEIISFLKGDLDDAMYMRNKTDASGRCALNFSGAGSRETLIILADQLNIKSLVTWPTQSESVILNIESSMGSPTNFNVQVAARNVEIDSFNYIALLTVWWS